MVRIPALLKTSTYILAGLIIWAFPAVLHAQTVYDYELIARIPVAANETRVFLGRGPSINNQGKVAFFSREQSVQGHIILKSNDVTVERDFSIAGPFHGDEFVQVNDADQIVFWEGSDDESCFGLPCISNLNRLDSQAGGEALGKGALVSVAPLDQPPFELVLPWASLNDSGRGIFGADTNGLTQTVLATRVGGSGLHTISPVLPDLPKLLPMISNSNRTIVRWGAVATSPIAIWFDEGLTDPNSAYVATTEHFSEMGRQPGISDDGLISAFMAKETNGDAGIFIADNNARAVFKVSDIPDNTYLDSRAGVNRSASGKPLEYTVAYLANSATNGQFGLYTVNVDISNAAVPAVSSPSLVAEVGSNLGPFVATVKDLEIYDPVNNKGQVAFWVRTTLSQAIIRVTPMQKEPEFRRADPNNDGAVNITDVIDILNYLFRAGNIGCADAADVNDDGEVDISDAVYTLLYLFANGKPPAAPFPNPGVDPTQDNTGCGP